MNTNTPDEKTPAVAARATSMDSTIRADADAGQHQHALPLCAACATSTPRLGKLLNDERIQRQIGSLARVMADIDWVADRHNQADTQPSANMAEEYNISSEKSAHPDFQESGSAPCVICSTKRAVPAITSLLVEVKAVCKEQAAGKGKAEKKALKSEIKTHLWEIKKEFKKAKKAAKKERSCAEWRSAPVEAQKVTVQA